MALMAPVRAPCTCGKYCHKKCDKKQLPNLTFMIGVLMNMTGNLDFYWANPNSL